MFHTSFASADAANSPSAAKAARLGVLGGTAESRALPDSKRPEEFFSSL
jgi:hypothetical protein